MAVLAGRVLDQLGPSTSGIPAWIMPAICVAFASRAASAPERAEESHFRKREIPLADLAHHLVETEGPDTGD